VFGINPTWDEAGLKPVQFKLNTERRYEQNECKFKERLDRLKMEQMKEYTFKPNLHSSNSASMLQPVAKHFATANGGNNDI
jgi:hypothetical protein